MSPATPDEGPKPFQCGECGMPLPITPCMTPKSVRVLCCFCGSRYLAEVWPSIPEHLQGNVRIVKD